MGKRVKLPGNGKAEMRKQVSAELPPELYKRLADDAALSKRSITKQLELIIENRYPAVGRKTNDAVRD